MNPVQLRAAFRSWPGLDEVFRETVRVEYSSPEAAKFQQHIAATLNGVRGKPCALGHPMAVTADYTRRLARFATAYHAAIETIVRAWEHDESVRRVLWTPSSQRADIVRDTNPANSRIHLCRLDLHLDHSGGFQVLETNANCPGALISSGIAGAHWRQFLSSTHLEIPDPLDHEWPEWTAQWFIENATVETGSPPNLIGLVRETGGNQLELPGIAEEFARAGIETIEVDPRDIGPRAPFRHAYLKLGIQAYTRMRAQIDPFMVALHRRMIFVQNGVRGRLVGDNKLCLAILSDPDFHYLFDETLLETISEHIPWTRALTNCPLSLLRDIRRNRSAYVLKHPFDTRGQGVVVGRGVTSAAEWARNVDHAVNNRWLVQSFLNTTELETTLPSRGNHRHDLCLGLINGKLSGAFARSGADLRLNLAGTGRLHPVFMAR